MKKFIALIATALTGLTVAFAAPASAEGASCKPVFTIGIGGYNDQTGLAYTGDVYRITWSAAMFPHEAGGPYDRSVVEGRDKVVAVADSYAAHCGGPIVVKGYSEGARAAGDALEILQTRSYMGRVSGVLYSDPKRPGGIEDALQGLTFFGITMTGPRAGFTVPVDSRCNDRDGICNMPFPHDIPKSIDNVKGYLDGAHGYDTSR